uniref:DNA polymerase alpha subunit B n=2 Tax=Ditylum brightwellii TaxID=49249 RepID=A0A7S2ERG3_9STRA|mmetsp:Transcript_39649/g.59583  ORF Transcript_39649/g.59583 Transcript_39649/m.59583 type:complete len:679 (+) Transcript_39649:73-2109(+)
MTAGTSTPGQLKNEIRKAMSDVGLNIPPDILSKCAAMAKNLSITPTQLAESWEAHSINRNISELTDVTFAGFRNDLLSDVESMAPSTVTSGAVHESSGLGKRHASGGPSQTPPPKQRRVEIKEEEVTPRVSVSPLKSKLSPVPPTPSSILKGANTPKYEERKNAGATVASYNPHSLTPLSSSSAPHIFYKHVEKCRFMFTTPQDRANALNKRLVEFGKRIQEVYDIKDMYDVEEDQEVALARLENVGVPRQEKVCCIGRICNEAHEGKLNRTSLLLEGSRHQSNGMRVNLDISPLLDANLETRSSFSLFPGQIVAVEGINASGRKLVAHKLCEGAAPPKAVLTAGEMKEFYKSEKEGMKIMTCAGPYTTMDNLEYNPLSDLLQQIREEQPDVVILTGPFVDIKHPLVQSGNVEIDVGEGNMSKIPHEALFAQRISALLEQLFEDEEGLGTQFVLVPHLDDAVAEFVYPQPPLSDRLPKGGKQLNLSSAEAIDFGSLGLHHIESANRQPGQSTTPKRIHCVPNPCTLRINEVTIGITSTDVLFHMNCDEANGNLPPGSRLARLTQHLIQQQSYYPLYPPPVSNARNSSVNLDLKQMEKWSMECQPDILIVPSKLTTFARKVLDTTVAINPGQLSRGTAGGTYAVMDVHPMKRSLWEGKEEDVEIDDGVQDRICVEIKRI